MKGLLLLFFLSITLLPKFSFSQVYLEPITGYQKDISNKGINFINTALQLAYKPGKGNELLFRFQKSFLQPYHHTDSAVTLNPSLPLITNAEKKLAINLFTAAVGYRLILKGRHSADKFYLSFYTGVMHQQISVGYDYDKVNYIVLNPDQYQNRTSIFFESGLAYMHQFKNNRFFCEINLSTPPVGHAEKNTSYTHLIAPLSVNIGYSIKLSKK